MLNFKHSTITLMVGYSILLIIYCIVSFNLYFAACWFILYLITIILGVVKLNMSFFLPVLYKGDSEIEQIAITFDDGPNTKVTPEVLKILNKHSIHATFFCIGKQILGKEELLKDIIQQGHIVGNHSYTHNNLFDFYSTKGVIKELTKTNELVFSIVGKHMQLFRPPFGVTNPNIAMAVKQLDLKTISWSIRTLDARSGEKKKILKKVQSHLQNGSIILLHDINWYVLEILEEIIIFAKTRGYSFVTIDKMFAIEAYKN